MSAAGRTYAEPRLGNSCRLLMRHDFKRAFYRAMLARFAPEVVKDFFSRIPLVIGDRTFRLKELLALLWSEKAMIPCWWDIATDNILEEFLLQHGSDPAAFLRKVFWLNNQSTYVPGKVLLTWLYPKMESLFSSVDTRDAGIRLITLFNEHFIPNLFHRRIRRTEKEGMVESTMMFLFDPSFTEFVDWDFDLIGGPQLLGAPTILGLPPLESYGMIADTRPPERIVWIPEHAPERHGGILRIGGMPAGRETGFLEFCKRMGLDLERYRPPDLPVVVMERDYRCPRRNRVVLHAGCAYGAPLFIHTLLHRKGVGAAKGSLDHLVSDLVREDREEKDELAEKHRALLASLETRAAFVYHGKDESISLNGEHLVKGISAKVLRQILSTHRAEGRAQFSYREFKREVEISLGQKNANFEVRFYRLSEKLREKTGVVNLVKTGRGTFRMDLDGEVVFTEE